MSGRMETTKAGERSLPQTVMALLRHYLGGRRNLMILAVAVLGIGAYFNWGWLVAAGVAPLLLALAPCAAMCALGLCMMPGKSNATGSKPGDPNAAATPSEPVSSVKADDRGSNTGA